MRPSFLLVLPLILLGAAAARADDPVQLDMTIENHVWKPAELHLPAGKKVMINVKNLDASAEEFDSDDLKVEKLIPGNGSGIVRIRPLAAGKYKFMGEYHPQTAQGTVVVE